MKRRHDIQVLIVHLFSSSRIMEAEKKPRF